MTGRAPLVCAILLCGAALAAKEKTIRLNDLPAGAQIKKIIREEEKGKTTYEAELVVNGEEKDSLVDAAGTVRFPMRPLSRRAGGPGK